MRSSFWALGSTGTGAGIALQQRGIHDFIIVDQWDRVGGTWHANTYPGVAVDIPSFVYSFSYEQRGDWSRIFAPGDELRDHADDAADQYGLHEKLRLSTTAGSAMFDERGKLVCPAQGTVTIVGPKGSAS